MSLSRVKKLSRSDSTSQCIICCTGINDFVRLGEKLQILGIVVHHLCMLSANNLRQNYDTEVGFYGYSLEDIIRASAFSKTIKCTYCLGPGALLKCRECRIPYHLPCSLKNAALFAFDEEFYSLCVDHRPAPNVTEADVADGIADLKVCFACFEPITDFKHHDSLKTPCCPKTWCHRHCVMELAVHQELLLNCPICRNAKEFITWANTEGIFFPQRIMPGEFDLCIFPRMDVLCTTRPCLYAASPNRIVHWDIVLCSICGANGTHRRCARIEIGSYWQCKGCDIIWSRMIQHQLEKQRQKSMHEAMNLQIDTAQLPTSSQTGQLEEHQHYLNHEAMNLKIDTAQLPIFSQTGQLEEHQHNLNHEAINLKIDTAQLPIFSQTGQLEEHQHNLNHEAMNLKIGTAQLPTFSQTEVEKPIPGLVSLEIGKPRLNPTLQKDVRKTMPALIQLEKFIQGFKHTSSEVLNDGESRKRKSQSKRPANLMGMPSTDGSAEKNKKLEVSTPSTSDCSENNSESLESLPPN